VHWRGSAVIWAGTLGAVAILGCGFADLLRPGGPRNVVLSYQGDSVLDAGSSVPFTIDVSADAFPSPAPTSLFRALTPQSLS